MSNLTRPGYCWYDNDQYTDAELIELIDKGGQGVAVGKLKEAGTMHWNSPNTMATNE